MHGELTLKLPALIGFLLVLTRVAGALAFVSIPGLRNYPEPARAVLAVSIAFLLFPLWPAPAVEGITAGTVIVWMVAEAAFGVTVGLALAMIADGLLIAMQVLGLQAGYSYVVSIDPTSQADSTVLQIFAQLAASLLFFSLGLDRQVIRIFAQSLATHPPGTYSISLEGADTLIRLGAGMFTTALRLALPVVALLLLVDLALALIERIHSQLNLLSLAFPAKMAAALLVLAIGISTLPRLYSSAAERSFSALAEILAVKR